MTALELINELKSDVDGNWLPRINELNLFQDKVQDLYLHHHTDTRTANIIFAYVILAYTKNSTWLNIHKDRTSNKADIMYSLAGANYKTSIPLVEAINGELDPYNSLIEWWIEEQCDQRFSTVLAGLEYHSKAQIMSKAAKTPKDMADSGKMLEYADKRLEVALDIYEKLKQENVQIDSALKKEKRVPLSERKVEPFNFMSHEEYLKRKNGKTNIDPDGKGNGNFFGANGEVEDRYEEDGPF